jgi:hypothetical protein
MGAMRDCAVKYRDVSELSRVPKIALELSRAGPYFATGAVDEAGMRRVKQLGVNDVLMGGPPIPWLEPDLRALIDKLKTGGLALGNLMITGFRRLSMGSPGATKRSRRFSNPFARQEGWDCL